MTLSTMNSVNQRVNSNPKSEINSFEQSEVSNFYNGKSVFITGAAGFLGVVILEILLTYCTGIKNIYILLRPKMGKKPEDRKADIFKKEIFDKLKEENPRALRKVIVVAGDVTQDNLGMSESDLERAVKEISVVFHCAACVSFSKPLSFTMNHNTIGTDNIIDFCHKLTKLEVLIYSSTILSNSNREDVGEKIYKLPFKAEAAVDLARKGNLDGLNHLFTSCNPPFRNFYTFSKCVAENLLVEKAHDIPLSVIRPSGIVCCTKGSKPGYVEDGTAIVNLGLGVGKGLIRVLRTYDNNTIPMISADIAANTHIVAAYLQVTKSLPSPSVYNCTKVGIKQWEEWLAALMKMVLKYPVPNSYVIPSITVCKSELEFKMFSFIYHYVPAYIIDVFLWLYGNDFRLVKTYVHYEKSLKNIEPFATVQWHFRCENFESLPEKLNSTDSKIFCVDTKDFNIESVFESLHMGCPFYRVGNKRYEDSLTSYLLRHFLTYLLRCFILGAIAFFFYNVLFKQLF